MSRKTITILPAAFLISLATVCAPAVANAHSTASSNLILIDDNNKPIDQSAIADGYDDNAAIDPADDDTIMSNDDGDDSDDGLSSNATE